MFYNNYPRVKVTDSEKHPSLLQLGIIKAVKPLIMKHGFNIIKHWRNKLECFSLFHYLQLSLVEFRQNKLECLSEAIFSGHAYTYIHTCILWHYY
jgi:hypothetical protein